MNIFSELRRRHVYKVGAAYAVAGWLLVQIATQVFPFFMCGHARRERLPGWPIGCESIADQHVGRGVTMTSAMLHGQSGWLG
jgi:hypothetical protein